MSKRTILRLAKFLPYRLSVISNLTSGVIATAYEQMFALRIPEWRLIAVIAESDGITQQAVGVLTHMDKVTVSRAAAALMSRGLIERKPNPSDGRSHLLHLSRTGRSLYELVTPKAIELEKRIFEDFSPSEVQQFAKMLTKIEKSVLATFPDVAQTGVDTGLAD